MKHLAALLVVAGCGGNTPPAKSPPPPAETASSETAAPAPAATQEPAAEATSAPQPPLQPPPPADMQPPPPPPKFANGADAEGPIPGLAGYSLKHKADKTFCTGVAIVMTRPKKAPKGDEKLAAVLAFDFPKGLDFSDKKKEASAKKFEKWIADYTKAAGDASTFYTDQAQKGDDTAKVIALARMAQMYQRFSTVLVHAAIPPDIRKGDMVDDKIAAYCDTLITQAEPIEAKANETLKLCADKLASVPKGWWNDVCAPQ